MKYYNMYTKARRLSEQDRHREALKIYKSLYDKEPENDLINYGIGYSLLCMYEDIRNHPEIVGTIREHIKKAEVPGIFLAGLLEEKLGNIEIAKKQYKKAIKFGNQYESFYRLITIEEKLDNREEAKKYYDMFKEVVKKESEGKAYEDLDNYSIFLLGKSAMEIDDLSVAEEIFNHLIDTHYYEIGSNICLTRISVKKRNYEEAYDRTFSFKSESFKNSALYLFILNKLDCLAEYETYNTYNKEQLLAYNPEKAIESIIKKHKDQFLDHVDPALMFHICNRNIKHLNPVRKLGDADIYHIDFTSDIAEVKSRKTNKIKVVTIADTKDILTLSPIITEDKAVDYNYTSDDDTEKSKQLSRIEKFNRKYNLQ